MQVKDLQELNERVFGRRRSLELGFDLLQLKLKLLRHSFLPSFKNNVMISASPKSSADLTSKTLSNSPLSTSQVWISNQCLVPEKTKKKKNRILNIIMFNFFDVWFPRNLRKRKGNGILNIRRKFFFSYFWVFGNKKFT